MDKDEFVERIERVCNDYLDYNNKDKQYFLYLFCTDDDEFRISTCNSYVSQQNIAIALSHLLDEVCKNYPEVAEFLASDFFEKHFSDATRKE